MAARCRPRSSLVSKDNVDEERNLWNQSRQQAKKIDLLNEKSNELSKRILELADTQGSAEARGELPSSSVDDELENALRENIRVCEEIQALCVGESNSNSLSLIGSLEFLTALRASSEHDKISHDNNIINGNSSGTGNSNINNNTRLGSTGKLQRNLKRKLDHSLTGVNEEKDSVAVESPSGPTAKVTMSTAATRLMGKNGFRSSSVTPRRETSVKMEDGANSDDSMKVYTPSDKHKLQKNSEVCYRNKAKSYDGEAILCSVTSVIGEGKQRRYEIMDSDFDPPTTPQPYRASVSHLVPVPSSNAGLSDLPPGKLVMALYPQTTIFYKAEVVACGKRDGSAGSATRNGGASGMDLRQGWVRLRFEGEDEVGREQDVERRYVIPDLK